MAPSRSISWTQPALDDLDDIAGFIALDKPAAAAAFVRRALACVKRLRRFPSSGRRLAELPDSLYREVIVTPCRIIYRLEGSTILVVHVLRGERLLRPQRLF